MDNHENIMPEYNEYLKQSQANPKQSTSNDSNTLTKKRERESEKKEKQEKQEKQETCKNIFFYNDSDDNGNDNMEDSSSNSEQEVLYEELIEKNLGEEDERLENFYDINLTYNKKTV